MWPAAEAVLAAWNTAPREAAVAEILPCNGSQAWAQALCYARPFAGAELVLSLADDVWRRLPLRDWQEAFASHPRLGERHAEAATAQSLRWSEGEQSSLSVDEQRDEQAKAALLQANRVYEAKFGRIFLVCASGKGAAEILALLELRLHNDPGTELLEAVEQQRRIMQLRLRKWLGLPAMRCDEV